MYFSVNTSYKKDMLEIGSLVAEKYRVLYKLRQDSVGIVYLAINEKTKKQWAIKEIRKDFFKNFEIIKQNWLIEIDRLKKLEHPNLPNMIEVIEDENMFLIVMEHIQGITLEEVLKEGVQSEELVIKWAKQLCDVLEYLHTRTPAIIYNDMKPSNVMLKSDGTVVLIDFKMAFKLIDVTCLRTIGYAAPEQFGGMGQPDARTDIYCLGTTLYHLLTGKSPCEPPWEILPIRQINPALSSGLERIILKCTQRNPEDRYQSCAELMYALEHYQEMEDGYIRRQRWKIGIFIIIGLLLFLCGCLIGIFF